MDSLIRKFRQSNLIAKTSLSGGFLRYMIQA